MIITHVPDAVRLHPAAKAPHTFRATGMVNSARTTRVGLWWHGWWAGAHVADGREDAATRDIGLNISCGDMSGRLAVESSRAGVAGSVPPLLAVRRGSGVLAAAGDGAGAGLAVADSGAAGVGAAGGGAGLVKEQIVDSVASMTSCMPRTPAAVARACSARSACTTSASARTAWITADKTCSGQTHIPHAC